MPDSTPPPIPPPIPLLPPTGYAPIWRDQRQIDADHLRLLSIFHYAVAALGVAFLGLLVVHYQVMTTMFTNPKFWQNMHGPPGSPPMPKMAPMPPEVIGMFKWFYLFIGSTMFAGMAVNVLSGWCIARRKARVFSLIVAGVDCLQFPFGTVLGVFTFVVLLRDSVREAYEMRRI